MFKIHDAEQGVTLVELMVSLAIGMLIVMFVSAMYVSSRGSYRVNDDNMRIQQDGRVIMHMLGQNLSQAGFGVLSWTSGMSDFEGQSLQACPSGQGFKNAVGDARVCDVDGRQGFEVSYRVEDSDSAEFIRIGANTDCNGQLAPLHPTSGLRTAINRFYLAPQGNGLSTLMCVGNGNRFFPQPLLNNVEAMRLIYGVDTNADFSADRFVSNAETVEGLAEGWKSVISVGVCLEIASANEVAPERPRFTDCSGNQVQAADRRLRTVLYNTFTLRNHATANNRIGPGT